MGEKTKIEWCDHTWNPWRGCVKIAAGCKNCYAARQSTRNPAVLGQWGLDGKRAIAAEEYWRLPHRWNAAARQSGERRRVFGGSMMDFFEENRSLDTQRWRALELIRECRALDWLILTKRPRFAYEWIGGASGTGWSAWPYEFPHVWLGFSASTQDDLDAGLPWLLRCRTSIVFLSLEPLLGPIDLTRHPAPQEIQATPNVGLHYSSLSSHDGRYYEPPRFLNWVIIGGESGPQARPCHPDWVRTIRDQCQAAEVAFFFKQWGEWQPFYDRDKDDPDWRAVPDEKPGKICRLNLAGCRGFQGQRVVYFKKCGKVRAGRKLDGREWMEFPPEAVDMRV